MTITNGYASLAEFKAMLNTSSVDSGDDAFIEDCIESASRYIDRQTGRTFYARTETHYFDTQKERELRMDDDLLSVTTLTNGDGTVLSSTYYNLVPKNKAPYFAISLKQSSPYLWTLDSNGNSEDVISVAGSWGYSAATPDDIKQACLMIAHGIYNRRTGENVSGVARITAAGVVITPQDIPSLASAIIKVYVKRL